MLLLVLSCRWSWGRSSYYSGIGGIWVDIDFCWWNLDLGGSHNLFRCFGRLLCLPWHFYGWPNTMCSTGDFLAGWAGRKYCLGIQRKQKDNQTSFLPSFKEMVCPAEPWPVFTPGEFSWPNFDPLAVTPISAFHLVSEISSTCLPSLATSSNFWPSKSSRQTRWGLCGAYLRLMLMLMVMLLLMFFLKLINRWGRCGICGKSTNKGGCSGWGRTWPKNIYLNIANGTSGKSLPSIF